MKIEWIPMVYAEERADGLNSIWSFGSGFRLNHAYTRMLHLDWKSENSDSVPEPLSVKITYGKAGSFIVEVQLT